MITYRQKTISLLMILLITAAAGADTFKNKETGETFTGYRTQKKSAGKTLVFNADENKNIPIDLSMYEITANEKGRRNSILILPLNQGEILLSEVVSRTAAESIRKGADSGAKGIILQIDLPGGQGAFMKNVTQAINDVIERTGCPVVAYVSGGNYGGAFSAAALVALTCEKIYISPTAAIGAVGPVTASPMVNQEYIDYIRTYSPDTLATFSMYAANLAIKRGRPELLARALVNKNLAIAEVQNADGTKTLVELSQRTPSQTVVRMITEGIEGPYEGEGAAPAVQGYGKLLNLPAVDALKWGIADKMASTVTEVISDMGWQDPQVVNAAGFTSAIGKFNSARQNLLELMSHIQYNEERATVLQDQILEMEKIARTGTTTREIQQGYPPTGYRGDRISFETYDRLIDSYYNEGDFNTTVPVRDRFGREISRGTTSFPQQERIYTEEPSGDIFQVQQELMFILNNLIADYRRASALGKRWPGALPMGVTLEALQRNQVAAQTLLARMQQMAAQGY